MQDVSRANVVYHHPEGKFSTDKIVPQEEGNVGNFLEVPPEMTACDQQRGNNAGNDQAEEVIQAGAATLAKIYPILS